MYFRVVYCMYFFRVVLGAGTRSPCFSRFREVADGVFKTPKPNYNQLPLEFSDEFDDPSSDDWVQEVRPPCLGLGLVGSSSADSRRHALVPMGHNGGAVHSDFGAGHRLTWCCVQKS